MNDDIRDLSFLQACQYVADHPYLNINKEPRRFAALSELLSRSNILVKGKFTNAKQEQSNYFIGKSISTKSIINSFIKNNLKKSTSHYKDKNDMPSMGSFTTEASFYICETNWRIQGFRFIVNNINDRFSLEGIQVIQQPVDSNDVCDVKVDLKQNLLHLEDLEGVVNTGEFYYFLFTLVDKITKEKLTFAYPIDFSE